MHSRIIYHIVWTTRDRRPVLDRVSSAFLYRYLRAVATQERSRIVALGIVQTHVHVLITAETVTDLPRLVQRFKGGSSVLINREGHTASGGEVRWAKGYAIHTVGWRGLDVACAYVESQAERHPDERIE
ncbi:MAG: IS200/IS605 family transposase [Gemmatimonadales bacterium]